MYVSKEVMAALIKHLTAADG